MQGHYLGEGKNKNLLIFVLGWASDPSVLKHIKSEGSDVLYIYDFRDMEYLEITGSKHLNYTRKNYNDFLPEIISSVKYDNLQLHAWSFGVWVAEQIFSGHEFQNSVAYNGTPYPVDELYGIEPRRLDITIKGLRKGGMETFNKRVYAEYYPYLKSIISQRSLEANIEELENLRKLSSVRYEPSIDWDCAIIGSEDKIFPPENMKRFWGNKAEILTLPHYPFMDRDIIGKIEHG